MARTVRARNRTRRSGTTAAGSLRDRTTQASSQAGLSNPAYSWIAP
jgi:hypothetical protein